MGARHSLDLDVMKVTTDDRLPAYRDEAGTAPGDRSFRPDVQGLRAVAILLVVLYHADFPGLTGGYVGVDVFFVISGFVITGVLLRKHASTGATSVLTFYARRARRIIPAATLVIIATVLGTYFFLGPLTGRQTAVDGQWAAVFLANFHFAASETNYLASQSPPSPLQNFWSLAVEEQFYILYPTVFLVVARIVTRSSLRTRIGIVLGATVIGSYALSIVLTSSNAPGAFFSPFTRAWELALGGLVAVCSDSLRRLPPAIAAGISWLGLGGILVAAFVFTSASVYPGSLVAIPVIGAGLIIAGGAAQPIRGVESVLRLRPLQLLGLVSYSLYLWHWPILIIATQDRGSSSLPVADNLLWLLVALVVAIGTYLVVENPIRHSSFLKARAWASIALGLCLIAAGLTVTTLEIRTTNLNLGNLAAVSAGSVCNSPSKTEIAPLRSTYEKSQPLAAKHRATRQLRMVVIGDSTACTMLPGLVTVGPSYGVRVENGALIGCGIVSGQIRPYYYGGVNLSAYTSKCQSEANDAEQSAIERGRPNVILWGSTDERDSIVVGTASKSTVLVAGTPRWKSVMMQRIETRVKLFIATGADVILLLQPPFVDTTGNPTRPTASDESFERMNAMLRDVAARYPRQVGLINLEERLCPSGPPCPYVVDGIGSRAKLTGVRPDGEHLYLPGSLWVAEWLVPRILTAVRDLR
jgi:peptidoglycan/LPS O-acetylase OafA/YrhL